MFAPPMFAPSDGKYSYHGTEISGLAAFPAEMVTTLGAGKLGAGKEAGHPVKDVSLAMDRASWISRNFLWIGAASLFTGCLAVALGSSVSTSSAWIWTMPPAGSFLIVYGLLVLTLTDTDFDELAPRWPRFGDTLCTITFLFHAAMAVVKSPVIGVGVAPCVYYVAQRKRVLAGSSYLSCCDLGAAVLAVRLVDNGGRAFENASLPPGASIAAHEACQFLATARSRYLFP